MSVQTIPRPPTRDLWMAERSKWFNASAAGVLFGCHPFMSDADYAVEKLSPADAKPQTAAMERGDRLEPVLLDWAGDQVGLLVRTPDVLYTNGCVMATLDGEYVGVTDRWIEAKTTAMRWTKVPEHVYWQVVAQGYACGRRVCEVVWIDADMRFKSETVNIPEADVEELARRAEEFMGWIGMGVAPEGVQLGVEHVKALHPDHDAGQWLDADEDTFSLAMEWAQARRTRLDADKAEKALADRVAAFVGSAEGVTYDGRELLTFRTTKPVESFDAKRFRTEHPDLAAPYTRTVTSRRLLPAKGLDDG